MNLPRRAFVTGLVTLAGCQRGRSQTGHSTTRPPATGVGRDRGGDTETARSTTRPPDRYLDSFGTFLGESGVSVQHVAVDEGRTAVSVTYMGTGHPVSEVDTVADGYFREVEAGWNVTRLEATVVDDEGTPVGRWHVESAWFEAYEYGRIDGVELTRRVRDTFERV